VLCTSRAGGACQNAQIEPQHLGDFTTPRIDSNFLP
jgi:hypothetical protein